jgi:hypothetical protein
MAPQSYTREARSALERALDRWAVTNRTDEYDPAVHRLTRRPRHLPWPTTVIWRWRWELAGASSVSLLLSALWLATGAWLLVVLPITISGLALFPRCRALLSNRVRGAVVQHRVRTGCAKFALHGRRGELPAILWTRVTPFGERLYVQCPPGLTLADFRSESRRLARACRSRSVRVRPHPRLVQVLVLDVVRRGPDAPTKPYDGEDDLFRPAPREEKDSRTSAAIRSLPRPRREQLV